MQKSDSIKELAAALSAAQNEFTAVPFNATNPFLHNQYADLGSVIATAKPILAKYGLAVSQLTYSNGHDVGVTTILMHSSGESIESSMALPLGDEKGKSLAQVAGSIVTYIRRYAYSAILGLYADEDTDGNPGDGKKPEKKPAATTVTKTTPPTKPIETEEQGKKRLVAELKAVYPDPNKIKEALAALGLTYTVAAHDPVKAALFEYALKQNGKPVTEAA